MAAREPNDSQFWTKALFPLRAFACVRLRKLDEIKSALNEAENGQNIFLEIDGIPTSFCLVDSATKQPSYEILFPLNQGRVDPASGTPRFEAFRLLPAGEEGGEKRDMTSFNFEVVGQLRHQYASRFLQMVGNHTSRIGVDFVKLP